MEDGEDEARQRAMVRLAWRWLWRFILFAAVGTVMLGLLAGLIGRMIHVAFPAWVSGGLASVAVLSTAGMVLPAIQRDLHRLNEPETKRPGKS